MNGLYTPCPGVPWPPRDTNMVTLDVPTPGSGAPAGV